MPDLDDPKPYEIRPDPQAQTSNPDPSHNAPTNVDYEPHPASSLPISPEHQHQHIIDSITRLYSGSASESDMQVYASQAVYDDPWSYCDTRYKIAGQWYGIPMLMAKSQTLKTEVVDDRPDRIVFKLQQEYTPKVVKFSKPVNSLITLSLDGEGRVKYHKDMWNHKDYSHEGLGKIMKTLNGDHLTKMTQPPDTL